MSREHDELEQQLADLPAPAARAEFRQHLRERFVAGGGWSAAPPASAGGGWRPWYAAAAVLVIALGAAIYVATRERDGRWTVLEGGAPAVVYVDGRDIDSGAAAELARALEGARTLATTTGPLRFELERVGRFELGERSELVLELVPEAGASDELVLELRSGALRVITVEPLAPTRVRVRAPDGEVRVVGTEFAVDIIPGAATCICCTRGAIEVSSRHHAGERLRIPAGGMAWCPSDGSATKTEDVVAEHRAPIEALRAVER